MRDIKCCLCLEGTRIVFEEELHGDDDASNYRCCQGTVHVKRACFYAGVSALIVCLFSVICMFFGVYSVNLWLDIVLIIVNAISAIIMLVGLYYDRAPYLIPFIVTEISQCACFFLLSIYVVYYTVTYRKQKFLQKFDQILMVVSIWLGILVCAAAVWAVAKCYHFLRQKEAGAYCSSGSRCMWE